MTYFNSIVWPYPATRHNNRTVSPGIYINGNLSQFTQAGQAQLLCVLDPSPLSPLGDAPLSLPQSPRPHYYPPPPGDYDNLLCRAPSPTATNQSSNFTNDDSSGEPVEGSFYSEFGVPNDSVTVFQSLKCTDPSLREGMAMGTQEQLFSNMGPPADVPQPYPIDMTAMDMRTNNSPGQYSSDEDIGQDVAEHTTAEYSPPNSLSQTSENPSTVPVRQFTCVFAATGCERSVNRPNELKRHCVTQHIIHEYWKCLKGPCARRISGLFSYPVRGNCFNRKDLYMAHLRRVHDVKDKKLNPKLLAEKNHHSRFPLPTWLSCPVKGCNSQFDGKRAFYRRMDHMIKKHLSLLGLIGSTADTSLSEWMARPEINILPLLTGMSSVTRQCHIGGCQKTYLGDGATLLLREHLKEQHKGLKASEGDLHDPSCGFKFGP